MDIRFSNILPIPLVDQQNNGNIWGSGKGKSTFAHIFYGLRKDFSGELYWGEKQYSAYTREEIQDKRTNIFGIVFQDLRLFLDQTPLENIDIHQSDLSSAKIPQEELKSFADRLGILNLLDKKCELLSYGQRQRVAILRALSRPFKWLILDEPFSHLDDENESIAAKLIMEVVSKNNASVVISGLNEVSNVIGRGKILYV